jgi:hypothetical protein
MKHYILIAFILLSLGACQEENEILYSVDLALAPYVDTFYSEAAERGTTIPKNLIAEFKAVQAITKGDKRNGQNYLYVDPAIFRGFNETQREAQIVYRLANIFLHKPEPGLVGLTESYDREQAFNSFFE